MTKQFDELSLCQTYARELARKVCNKTIKDLRRTKVTLSGGDTELENVWEEICVQLQNEESIYWDTYVITIKSMIDGIVDGLRDHEIATLWLLTDDADEWLSKEPEDRGSIPAFQSDIVEHLFDDYVCQAAENYSNSRIRDFLYHKAQASLDI